MPHRLLQHRALPAACSTPGEEEANLRRVTAPFLITLQCNLSITGGNSTASPPRR